MLILIFLLAALSVSSSTPVLSPLSNIHDPPTLLTIFNRDLPECVNVARYRTMQDIIWSCLATIFACTWVAVHPNVPDSSDSGWTKFKQRLTIMIYAVVGPEFVTMWALRQRIGAKMHMKEYNKKFHLEGPWTLTHGFLLEMDGLMEYTDGTPSGVLRDVDDISERFDMLEEEINDKSKGDFFTKLLVILQMAWFIFQCLARWITHLPVTELEVVTLAFAFLNLITYSLWWYKPQNMQVAIPLHVRALPRGTPCDDSASLAEEKRVPQEGGTEDRVRSPDGSDLSPASSSSFPFSEGDSKTLFDDEECQVEDGKSLLLESPELYDRERQSLDRIALFTRRLKAIPRKFIRAFSSLLSYLASRQSPQFYTSQTGVSWKTLIPFSVVSLIFGGLHMIPVWTSSFPSPLEKLLWRLAAFWITIEPALLLCTAVLLRTDLDKLFVGAVIDLLMFLITMVGGLLYGVARMVLVVLVFTTLRDLPTGAYQSIAWTTFLPHF
ncbi:hypothetical protein P691DRAFT_736685 [Macrolepiota fuliginosa MF-IS2]|uniref:Uncharacterized protein n=1 Tax=Macrolepiota fuliginosa MF-IS2 TaxID=1400762 RepID=A0A9P6C0E0_9AGAR|nr:hypothetical protein P691DRAFT_736685 [Macrolepiota fuliginosa MF-IS2]